MKKRIALAAAIALAISVSGMLPASATKLTAPTVESDSCARAGGTLEIQESDGNISVSLGAGVLVVTQTGGTVCASAVPSVSLALAGLTSVILKADDDTADANYYGNITIDLEYPEGYVANFGSIPMTLRAEGTLTFDGSDLTETAYRPFVGTITEETFAIGSVTGSYYAGALAFKGGDGNDALDASAVTTTDVSFDGYDGDDTFKGGAGDDSANGGTGDDILYGNAGDDSFSTDDGGTCTPRKPNERSSDSAIKCRDQVGASGADEAWGGLGEDTFDADAADTIAPGDGQDMFDISTTSIHQLNYSDSSVAITVNLTSAPGLVKTAAGDDVFTGVSVAEIVGSNFADVLIGGSSSDAFFGGAGADKLFGLGSAASEANQADFLSGQGGADIMKGGLGNDVLYGDTGADLMNGGNGNDTIYGGGGDDIAYGSMGDDIIRGEKGSDQAWGGRGTFDVCAAEVTDSCEFKK